ncbi:MAG: transposase [Muribaculaceae bacterium]|nr:transposase [Muribaculaceae bacterium]
MGYTTDLTHRQRNYIFENFPEIFKTKSKSDIFEILNALFFLINTGCQWKLLPNDFPKWRTVYEFYRKWISIGFFDRLTREQYLYAAKELQWWRVRCLCCGSSDSAPSPIHHKHLFSQLSVAQVTIAPALTNIGEQGLSRLQKFFCILQPNHLQIRQSLLILSWFCDRYFSVAVYM